MLSIGKVLGLGGRAARQQAWLLMPLSLATALGRLLGLVPMLFIVAMLWRSFGGAESDPARAMKAIETLSDPSVWLVAVQGLLLATFGTTLLHLFVEAGCLRQLGAQIGHRETVEDSFFARGLIESSVNALATGLLALVLRLVALGCAFGTVIIGMSYFTEHPGVVAALLMTIATGLMVVQPLLMAALELGFVRSVLLGEGPGTALGNGLIQAYRRSGVLVPVWFVLGLVEVAVVVGVGIMSGTIDALPQGHHFWVLLLGPRGVVWVLGIVLAAAVTLWRLGAYSTFALEDAGTLPSEASPAEEMVLQAVPVAAAVAISRDVIETEPGEDEPPPSAPTPDEGSE